MRASVAGLLAVLCFLAGFSVITQHRVATESKRADTAMRLSATYQDARHWVTEAKSIERGYHFEGSGTVRFAYERATQDLDADLHHVVDLDPSPANRAAIDRLLGLSTKSRDGELVAVPRRRDVSGKHHLRQGRHDQHDVRGAGRRPNRPDDPRDPGGHRSRHSRVDPLPARGGHRAIGARGAARSPRP